MLAGQKVQEGRLLDNRLLGPGGPAGVLAVGLAVHTAQPGWGGLRPAQLASAAEEVRPAWRGRPPMRRNMSGYTNPAIKSKFLSGSPA